MTCLVVSSNCVVRFHYVVTDNLYSVVPRRIRVVDRRANDMTVGFHVGYLRIVIAMRALVDRRQVFQVTQLYPSVPCRVSSVFLHPMVLRPVANVARPFVVRVTVMVNFPRVCVMARRLHQVVLRQLPLHALFPGTVSAFAAQPVAMSRSCLQGIHLSIRRLIAACLVLRAVSCFIHGNEACQLTNTKVCPRYASYVIMAKAYDGPLDLVRRMGLRLVFVRGELILPDIDGLRNFSVYPMRLFNLYRWVVGICARCLQR